MLHLKIFYNLLISLVIGICQYVIEATLDTKLLLFLTFSNYMSIHVNKL